MFWKKKRIEDRALLDEVARQPCLICGKRPSDPDHIISRGAGGDDTAENVWPLCRKCHSRRHSIGLTRFAFEHRAASYALIKRGFGFDVAIGRWSRGGKSGTE